MCQPSDSQEAPAHEGCELLLDSTWVPSRYETVQCGCALGRRSSPFRRFGAIFGVPNAYHDLSFDLSCQTFHQMPVRLSPVSSRDLASSGLLCMPTKEVRRSGYADIHGSGSALRLHVLRECSGPHCGAVGSARNRPRGRSPRWIRTSAAAQNPRSRDRVRRWRRGSPRCNLCSLAP